MQSIDTKQFSLLILLFCFNSLLAFAQPPTVTATLDKHEALEGDVVKLTLSATHEKGITMQFPLIGQAIDSLEVLEIGELTQSTEDKLIRQTQEISIIVFDSGYYGIPYFEFSYTNEANGKGGKIRTQPLLLNVTPRPIDMEEDIKTIKAPIDLPKTLWERWSWLVYLWIFGLFCWFVWWLYQRSQRKEDTVIQYKAPPLPAHTLALQKLQQLDEAKLWQKGEVKAYYSEVTEIIREYIENRYEVQALEQTTDEIIENLKETDLNEQWVNTLRKMLYLADLVKFAKAKPDAEQHVEYFKNSRDLVLKTKKKEQLLETKEEKKA